MANGPRGLYKSNARCWVDFRHSYSMEHPWFSIHSPRSCCPLWRVLCMSTFCRPYVRLAEPGESDVTPCVGTMSWRPLRRIPGFYQAALQWEPWVPRDAPSHGIFGFPRAPSHGILRRPLGFPPIEPLWFPRDRHRARIGSKESANHVKPRNPLSMCCMLC